MSDRGGAARAGQAGAARHAHSAGHLGDAAGVRLRGLPRGDLGPHCSAEVSGTGGRGGGYRPEGRPMSSPVSVDPAEIERFVNALFPRASEGGFVSVRAFFDDELAKRSNEKPFKISHGPAQWRRAGAGHRGGHQDRRGCRAIQAPGRGRARRSRRSPAERPARRACSRAWCFPSSWTRGRPLLSPALRAVIGPPTLVVASGGMWTDTETGELHDKLHVHWRLNEPTQAAGGAPSSEAGAVARLRSGRGRRHLQAGRPPDADGRVRCIGRIRPIPSWHGSSTSNPDSEISLDDVLSELEGLAILRGEADDADPAPSQGDPTADSELLHQCAERITNADLEWAAWNRLGMAFWRASDGSEAGFQAFDTVSRKSAKYDAEATRARWAHYRNFTSRQDRRARPWSTRPGRPIPTSGGGGHEAHSRADRSQHRARSPAFGRCAFDTSHDGLALDLGGSGLTHGMWRCSAGGFSRRAAGGSGTRTCCI